jgi:hypothetical protein
MEAMTMALTRSGALSELGVDRDCPPNNHYLDEPVIPKHHDCE